MGLFNIDKLCNEILDNIKRNPKSKELIIDIAIQLMKDEEYKKVIIEFIKEIKCEICCKKI